MYAIILEKIRTYFLELPVVSPSPLSRFSKVAQNFFSRFELENTLRRRARFWFMFDSSSETSICLIYF